VQDEAVRAHQPTAADNTAAASGGAQRDVEADRRLFEELERTTAYLHRDGCGDGAAAVQEAIRRLRATQPR
jgi:hypothetical protein